MVSVGQPTATATAAAAAAGMTWHTQEGFTICWQATLLGTAGWHVVEHD